MIKISKELLSEVLNLNITYIERYNNSIIYKVSAYDREEEVNIYELAYRCKEWTLNKGYEIVHMADTTKVYKNRHEIYNVTNVKIYCLENFFEACEWVRKN